MRTAALIYPHQLFADHPATKGADATFLVEDPLFFRQYPFHKQKLMLHRASMLRYAQQHPNASIVESRDLESTGDIATVLKKAKFTGVQVVDPSDDLLLRRLTSACDVHQLELSVLPDPHFLTSRTIIDDYVARKTKLFFTDFYIEQRKRLGILVDNGKPLGEKWSFDADNRKKLPKGIIPPTVKLPPKNKWVTEARESVRAEFGSNFGEDGNFTYPTSHAEARAWMNDFMEHRFADFGQYEDAISARKTVLFHSVLTPMLNIGLLSPREVVDAAIRHADRVPMNSLEGFLRQVIGWREFVRLVYLTRGRQQRTCNFWAFTHSMPKAFYDGTTGIEPSTT
jgi:deoxyribodipyrimidine photolyase-related protein